MLPFSTWREVFRIPWVRRNSQAVRLLSDVFYLLMALYRTRRLQEFSQLRCVFFEMIDSFAQHGRSDAKDTVDELLKISWFQVRHRDLYRMIGSYNRVIAGMSGQRHNCLSMATQQRINEDAEDFVVALKKLAHFDERDEVRVNALVQQPELMDVMVKEIFAALR